MTDTPRKGTKAYLEMRLQKVEKTNDLLMKMNSTLTRRAEIARGLGKSFGGDRDLYTALGYPVDPQYTDFINLYERDGLATRVVDAVSDETWSEHPVIYEGDEAPDEDTPSPLGEQFDEWAKQYDLWAKFTELDENTGHSRFSLLFLGLPGQPQDPVQPGSKLKLSYISVHDEGDGEIDESSIVKNAESERFGLPDYYYVIVDATTRSKIRVHHSRIMHYKEGRQRTGYGRVYGVPRLKNIINRFYDLEKVVGGGSEAFWLLIRKGLALTAVDDMQLPQPGTDAYDNMVDEIEEYEHGISRIMKLIGVDVKDLGSEPVSSRDQFDVLIEYISGSEQIPQRILLGSERGNLASSQDEANWLGFIDRRRKNRAEPYILRPFIKMGMELGIFGFDIPGDYKVWWPELFHLTELEEATEASTIANAINTISGGVPDMYYPPEEFMNKLPNKWKLPKDLKQIDAAQKQRAAIDKKNQVPKANIKSIQNVINGLNGNKTFGWLTTNEKNVVLPFAWLNADENSTMVALIIPELIRKELKAKYDFIQDDVLSDLHITLCYIGDIRTLDKEKIFNTVSQFASTVKPLKIKLQGIARFNSEMEQDPIVATFDSQGNELVDMRGELVEALKEAGIPYHDNHGYIPHMTLAYIPKDAPIPVDNLDPLEMNFDACYVAIGKDLTKFEFGKVYDPATTSS